MLIGVAITLNDSPSFGSLFLLRPKSQGLQRDNYRTLGASGVTTNQHPAVP